ncbi:MAG: DMT family transporter [Nocardioidaceae bacterium]
MTWLMLSLAIVLEVTGTLSLRASEGFTRIGFSLVTAAGYSGAFYLLSLVLKQGMPVGVAYGIWSAVGVALVAVLGRVVFGDPLTLGMWVGFVLIIGGVLLVETGVQNGH